MNKFLLSIFFLLIFGSIPGYAQTEQVLGQATGFAVLAATEVNNAGITGITGNVGVSPGTAITGQEQITVQEGKLEINSTAAAAAQIAALKAYNDLKAATSVSVNFNSPIVPGTYTINSDLDFNKVITLSSKDNTNGKFVFIVNGNINTEAANAAIRLVDNATAEKVYWVVSGNVNISSTTGFVGTILAKGDIALNTGIVMPGRAISLEGSVTLTSSNVYLPTLLRTDVGVRKPAPAGDFKIGDLITYTITAYNNGPGTATGVVVDEVFPQDKLSYVSAEPSQGTLNTDVYPFKWQIGTLQYDEEVTLKITFRVIGIGTILNNVNIISDDVDPNPGDNNGGEPVEVTCPVPTLAITGETNLCDPLQDYTFTVTEVPGATYNFTLPTGWIEVSRNENTITVKAPVSGTLTATVTDKCGRPYTTERLVSMITDPGELTINGNVDGICINTNGLSFTANGALGIVTYKWIATGGITIAGDDDKQTVEVNVGASAGTLAIIATSRCGVSTPEEVITITPTGAPVLPTAIIGKDKVCAGLEEIYQVTAVEGLTYNWSLPEGWEIIGEPNGARIRVLIGAIVTAGKITVTAENACLTSTELVLDVQISGKAAAPAGITATAGSCPGSEVTYSVINPIPGRSYSWLIPTGDGWEALTDLTLGSSSIKVKLGTTNGAVQAALIGPICGPGQYASLDVTPTPAPVAPGAITGKQDVCIISGTTTYSVSAVSGLTYNWSLPEGWNVISGQGTNSITVDPGIAGGTIAVTATNACNATSPETALEVRITPQPSATGSIIDNGNVCDGLSYAVEAVPGASSYNWSVSEGFTITEGQGTRSIKVRADSPKATGTVSVVTVTNECASPVTSAAIDITKIDGQLNFPKAFSPNNDGKNDTWVITNLEKFPENEITIMNRWGSEVYKVRNYNNTWNGQGLEQGTYFYKVKVKVCAGVVKEYTGYVAIYR